MLVRVQYVSRQYSSILLQLRTSVQGVIYPPPPFNYDWVSIAGYWNNSWPFFSNIFWLLFSFPPSTPKSCMTPCCSLWQYLCTVYARVYCLCILRLQFLLTVAPTKHCTVCCTCMISIHHVVVTPPGSQWVVPTVCCAGSLWLLLSLGTLLLLREEL